MKILEGLFGTEHPEYALNINDLAWVYFKKGKFEEASTYYHQSLKIRQISLGEDHPDVARSYHEIAELLTSQSKFEQAEEFNRKALVIREKVLGTNHVDYARSKRDNALHKFLGLHNLALLQFAQGRYEESEKLHKQSLSILETALGIQFLISSNT